MYDDDANVPTRAWYGLASAHIDPQNELGCVSGKEPKSGDAVVHRLGFSPRDLPSLRYRLAFLMFLQFAAPSAVVQLYSLHLKQLNMGPVQTGICSCTQALATVLIALFVGHVADRWFSAERCLAVCSLLGSLVLWLLSSVTNFWAILTLTALFWLLVNPTMMLGATISFTHLPDPERQYGSVRLWGTLGWMVPGWLLLGFRHLPGVQANSTLPCSDLFRLGSLFGLVLGLYALTIPHTPPRPGQDRRPAPLAALALLRGPSFLVFFICTLGVCITFPFTAQATPLLLKQLGVPILWLSPTLTLCQLTEAITLAMLPMLFVRLGMRGTMLLGLLAWLGAMSILALGRPLGLVIASLSLNGVLVSAFLVSGQVFVNTQASGDLRASVQSLISFVNGFGQLLGHLLIGWLRWFYEDELPRAFSIAALITGCLLVLFLMGFRTRSPRSGFAGQDSGARTEVALTPDS